jgi:hypothetical protein
MPDVRMSPSVIKAIDGVSKKRSKPRRTREVDPITSDPARQGGPNS